MSWWDLESWRDLKKEFDLEEYTFNQQDLGGKASKPTTFGTNLLLEIQEHKIRGRKEEEVKDSKDLSRWAPGMMSMIAKALIQQALGMEPQLRSMSIQEHVAFGHIPYRRDCFVCQQSLQQGLPHRRIKFPVGGSLSLDTAGPLKQGQDVNTKAKFFLCGALTWAVPKGTEKMKETEEEKEEEDHLPKLEEEKKGPHDGDDARPAESEQGGMHSPEGEGRDARPRENGDVVHLPEEKEKEGPQDGDDARPAELEQGGMHSPEGEGRDARPRPDGDAAHLPEGEERKEEFEMRTFRLAIPIPSKHAKHVTEAAMTMVMQLRMDGFHVQRIHTDRGREFAKHFHSWARNRGIHCTMTAGDEPQQNGRAELSIKTLKSQTRRLLREANLDSSFWPLALRHANALNRCLRLDTKPDWPSFYQDVLIRKRRWKRDDFSTTYETAKYIEPSPEDHGHWVVGEDGSIRLTRCYLRRAKEIPNEDRWFALEKETVDALVSRRRIREKTAIRKMMDEELSEDEEEKRRKVRLHKILEEEMKAMIEDEEKTMELQSQVLMKLKKAMQEVQVEEDEVLQTKVVSQSEVQRDWKNWKEAAESEIRSLLEEKEAFKPINKEELEKLIREAHEKGKKVEFLPSKVVWTRKAGKNGGKTKSRWVICGNFEQKKEGENNFSSGADACALRVIVAMCARNQWCAGTLDVKTAFLNAVYEDLEEDSSVIVIRPPNFLVDQNCLPKDVCYIPLRAVYGLRRSPKLWGITRDEVIEMMEVNVTENGKEEKLRFKSLDSEPNLWRIYVDHGQQDWEPSSLRGFLLTYVDDLFVCGTDTVLTAVMKELRSKWTTTEPDRVSEVPIKFLGIEISKRFVEEKGRDLWYLSQDSYTRDLLEKQEKQVKSRKTPISKDLSVFPEEPEEGITEEKIRRAQKQVGELLWLVTRTRPDLSYTVSRMGSHVTKHPDQVDKIFDHTIGFLKETTDDGICFDVETDAPWRLDCVSDSSFSPEGAESHGAFVVTLNGSCVFWRSGRQSFVTTSTAETELVEVVESMIAGESIAVILEEVVGQIPRAAWSDNQAAIAILTQDGSGWRTRHLKIRAAAAREAIKEGMWVLSHRPGERLIADLGTKALNSSRFQMLKKEMKMSSRKKEDSHDSDARPASSMQGGMHLSVEDRDARPASSKQDRVHLYEEEVAHGSDARPACSKQGGMHLPVVSQKKQKIEKILQVVTIATLVVAAKTQEEEEEEREDYNLDLVVILYSIFIVIVTLIAQWMWKVGVRQHSLGWSSQNSQEDGSRPAEVEQKEEEEEENFQEPDQQEEVAPRPEENAPLPREVAPPPEGDPSQYQEPGPREERLIQEERENLEAEVIAMMLEEEMEKIAEEENRLWDEIIRDPAIRFPRRPENERNLELPFDVFLTRYGQVYHNSLQCTYLTAPRTGAAFRSNWCSLCKMVALQTRGVPPPGSALWIEGSGRDAHTSSRCPRLNNMRLVQLCSQCPRAV